MSETTHTPGPWIVEFAEDGGYDCITDAYKVRDSVGRIVADLNLGVRNPSPAHMAIVGANANLIAAAPDLLTALEPFASIEECGSGFLVTDEEHRNNGCHECEQVMTARAAIRKARGESA